MDLKPGDKLGRCLLVSPIGVSYPAGGFLTMLRWGVRNYLGVSFRSLLVNGVWGDTAAAPLSVNT
jgi:hypothetical protein